MPDATDNDRVHELVESVLPQILDDFLHRRLREDADNVEVIEEADGQLAWRFDDEV